MKENILSKITLRKAREDMGKFLIENSHKGIQLLIEDGKSIKNGCFAVGRKIKGVAVCGKDNVKQVTKATTDTRTKMGSQFKDFRRELNETYQPLVDIILGILGAQKASPDEPIEIREQDEPKIQMVEDFIASYLNSLFGAGVPRTKESIEKQKAIMHFSIAITMVSMIMKNNLVGMKQYLDSKGVKDFEALPHFSKMCTQNSPLAISVQKTGQATAALGNYRKLLTSTDGDMGLMRLIRLFYNKWKNAKKSPKKRKYIKKVLDRMLEIFDQECKNNPELDEFLNTAAKQMLIHVQKEINDTEGEDNLFEQHTELIDNLFTLKAPELKTALNQLFPIKALDGKRACKWMQTEPAQIFLKQLGVNVTSLNDELINTYLQMDAKKIMDQLAETEQNNQISTELRKSITILTTAMPKAIETARACMDKDLEDEMEILQEALETISDNQDVSTLNDEIETVQNIIPSIKPLVIKFLLNTPLGRKQAREMNLDFNEFKKAITNALEPVLQDLLHQFPEGIKANSIKELIAAMATSKNLLITGDYEHAIYLGKIALEQTKIQNEAMLNTLSEVYKEQPTNAKALVSGIVDELENDPDYRETIGQFNLLVNVKQGRVIPPSEKGGMIAPFRKALAECNEAYGDRRKGFNRFYSQEIPGVEPKKCDFSQFRDPFDFRKLIEQYAEGIPDTRLVDVEEEIETQILQQIMTGLGTIIGTNKTYSLDSTHYISEEDFNMAKQMKESLMKIDETKGGIKEEEEKISNNDAETEEKTELTATHRRHIKKTINPLRVLITNYDKKMAEKKAKQDAKKEKK